MPEVIVVGWPSNATNALLVSHWRTQGVVATLLTPPDAESAATAGDVVLGRLDVLPGLDGIEGGLLTLHRLKRRGIRVLNRASALIAVHDKLLTARRLTETGLPHPRSASWSGDGVPPLEPPVVLKPRFGSWGRDVLLCEDLSQLAQAIKAVRARPWFRRHGAVLQALVPPRGYDLRLLVAAGQVVGASERVAARGEWRTNVALGGNLRSVEPPPAARSLAIAAAAAVGADLVGVDLLPCDDGYTVLELNGAVDFDERYSLGEGDLYLDIATALALPIPDARPRSASGRV
jgi:RimK family alpha-L-glutamate ligase